LLRIEKDVRLPYADEFVSQYFIEMFKHINSNIKQRIVNQLKIDPPPPPPVVVAPPSEEE
jgi:hypothetical protein